jgi:recombination protein RecA
LDIRRIQAIKEGDKVVGSRTRGKVVKNKVAAPFREAEFDILYGEGISREGDLIDLGVDKGLIEKSGTWMSYGTERMGQGRENSRVFLKENVGVRDKLEAALRKNLGLPIKMSASNGNGAAPAEEAATPAKTAQAEKPAPAAHGAAAGANAGAARPRPATR